MSLRSLIDQMRRSALMTPARVYAAGAARRAVLACHADVGAVWTALVDDREETYPARDALTRALVVEHRSSGHPLWASMLTVAYYPMLSRLRHRLVSDRLPREELDQLVLTAFVVAIAELPTHEEVDRIAMRLRQRTARQVFASLRKERGEEHAGPDPEELTAGDEQLHGRCEDATDHARLDLALLLERAAAQGIAPGGLDVIDATIVRRERLRSYVARTTPDDAVARERTYQRLKRQRSRALRRLRTLLDAPLAGATA